MVNCIPDDVRTIIDTGLTDEQLTGLIEEADAEMLARGLTGSAWTLGLKKTISKFIAASHAAMNDVRSHGKADYAADKLPQYYRERAEALITQASYPALISYNEPVEGEDE